MKKFLILLLCLGLIGCATAEFARYRGGGFESAVPIYQGEPPQQYSYGSIGYIKGQYKAQVFDLPGDKISRALQNMANTAKAMGANGIIKLKLHSGISVVYYEGEAVVFNAMPNQ
jgi:hypothetical protein